MGRKERASWRDSRTGKISMEQNSVNQKRQGNQAKYPNLATKQKEHFRSLWAKKGPSGLALKDPRAVPILSESRLNFPAYSQRLGAKCLCCSALSLYLFPTSLDKSSISDSYFLTNFHWENLNFGFTIFSISIPLALNTGCLFPPWIWQDQMSIWISFDAFASWLCTWTLNKCFWR